MSLDSRKIAFYSIVAKDGSGAIDNDIIFQALDYVSTSLDYDHRTFKCSTKTNKMCVLDRLIAYINDVSKRAAVMSSGKVDYFPPVRTFQVAPPNAPINHNASVSTRNNPKRKHEGEEEKTHVIFKMQDDFILVLYEDRNNIFTFSSFIKYLKHIISLYCAQNTIAQGRGKYTIDIAVIVEGDFLDLLDNVERIKVGKVLVEKQVLGSTCLNFSNRTSTVQDEILIEVKARKGTDIKQTISDFFNTFASDGTQIKKISVEGINDDKYPIKFDTESCKKKRFITVEVDDVTSTVDTQNVLALMNELLSSYLEGASDV